MTRFAVTTVTPADAKYRFKMVSAGRADDMLDRGQIDGAAVWRRIVKAIEALLALDPTGAIN